MTNTHHPHNTPAPDSSDHWTAAGGDNRMDVTAERGRASVSSAVTDLDLTPASYVCSDYGCTVHEEPPPRVVALDLSIRATGRCWPDGSLATLTTSAGDTDDDRVDSIAYRIGDDLEALGLVDLVAIEAGVYRSQAAFVLGMLHRAVRTECRARGIPFLLVPPASVKTYATGKGNATKATIRVELYKRTGVDIADDNQADAWALRALVLDLLGFPVLELPKTHRRALVKLAVPAGYRGPLVPREGE